MIFVIFFAFSAYWLTGMLLLLVLGKSTKKIDFQSIKLLLCKIHKFYTSCQSTQ